MVGTEIKLTTKQSLFCFNYVLNPETWGNATQSAKLAKYGGNDNILGVVGHGNLNNPKIKQEIARLKALKLAKRDKEAFDWRAQQEHVLSLALDKGDLSAANIALASLGRAEGQYEADNHQRKDQIGIVIR